MTLVLAVSQGGPPGLVVDIIDPGPCVRFLNYRSSYVQKTHKGAVMALMDESVWRGKIFSGGWVTGEQKTDAPVIEPATGQEIGRTGIASPADVARAAQRAAAAQPAWAATPHTERSAILRRAADIWLANA